MIAPTISGNGTLSAMGGTGGGNSGPGGLGRLRLEAFADDFSGTTIGVVSRSGPGVVFIPNTPTIRITAVGGQAVPAVPLGIFGGVDVVVGVPGTYAVDLAAFGVPLGTTIAVTAKPEFGAEVVGPVPSSGLTGTVEEAVASVDVNFPVSGVWFLEARATYTP